MLPLGSVVLLLCVLRATYVELSNTTTPINNVSTASEITTTTPFSVANAINITVRSTAKADKPITIFTDKPMGRAIYWTTPKTINSTPQSTSWDRKNNTSQSKTSSSLLSSLLTWPMMFQTPAKSNTSPRIARNGTNNTTQGRNAGLVNDKNGVGASQHHYQYSHSNYGSYKPEMQYGPKYGDHHYKEVHTKYLYAPPPHPPPPPDGALAPVYHPYAKVAVTADFIELKCSVYGDYLPHIRWVKLAGFNHVGHMLFTTIAEGPHVIYDNYHYAVRSDGRCSRLIIREPDPHVHYGTYECQVMVPGDHTHVSKDDFVVGDYH